LPPLKGNCSAQIEKLPGARSGLSNSPVNDYFIENTGITFVNAKKFFEKYCFLKKLSLHLFNFFYKLAISKAVPVQFPFLYSNFHSQHPEAALYCG
jgi:hypothetical protein